MQVTPVIHTSLNPTHKTMMQTNKVSNKDMLAAGLPPDFDPNGDCSIEQAKIYDGLINGVPLLLSNPNHKRNARSNAQSSNKNASRSKESRSRHPSRTRGPQVPSRDQATNPSRTDVNSSEPRGFNKRPPTFNVCRRLVNTGVCAKCQLSPRQAIETLACFLAIEGITAPTETNAPNFLSVTITMLSRTPGYEQIAANFRTSLRAVPLPCDYPIPELTHCEIESTYHRLIDHPPEEHAPLSSVKTTKEIIQVRLDDSLLAETPINRVRPGYGIYGGCSTELNLLPSPQLVVSSVAEDVVYIHENNWRTFALMDPPCHPAILSTIEENFNNIQSAYRINDSRCIGIWDALRSLFPSPSSAKFTYTVRCPQLVNVDVTDYEPHDYIRYANRSPFSRVPPSDDDDDADDDGYSHFFFTWLILLIDLVLANLMTEWFYMLPVLLSLTFFRRLVDGSFTKRNFRFFVSHLIFFNLGSFLGMIAYMLSYLASRVSGPGFEPIIYRPRQRPQVDIFNPSTPDDRRLCLPSRSRLEPHAANIAVGRVYNVSYYINGVPKSTFFYSPEILYNTTPSDIFRPESTWIAAWTALDNKNTNIAYPPAWRGLILTSSSIYGLLPLVGAFDHSIANRPPIRPKKDRFCTARRILISIVLSIVIHEIDYGLLSTNFLSGFLPGINF